MGGWVCVCVYLYLCYIIYKYCTYLPNLDKLPTSVIATS